MTSVLVILSIVKIGTSIMTSCNTYMEEYGSTFNICPLTLTSQNPYYTVNDAGYEDDPDIGIRYHFNVGNSVLEYPSDLCANTKTGPCDNYTSNDDAGICENDGIIPVEWKTWVYSEIYNKKNNTVTECKHLSNYTANVTMGIGLYSAILSVEGSEMNPTEGIFVDVNFGDYDVSCSWGQNYLKNQWFRLILECADDIENIPDDEYVFFLPYHCRYYMKMKSLYGCPAECEQYDSHLCAGNGFCGYDFTNTIPKCMCYKGYHGANCATPDTTDDAQNIIPAVNDEKNNDNYSHSFPIPPLNNNVTYDLTAAHLENGDYKVYDDDSHWIFLFDLDSFIDPAILPKVCNTSSGRPCKEFGNNTCIKYQDIPIGQGVAFRHNIAETKCHLLGTDISFELYDANEPGKGINFVGSNGEYCSALNKNRGGTVQFHCSNSPTTSFAPPKEFTADVSEDDPYDCDFTIWTELGFACPWNCLEAVTSVINGVSVDGWNICSLHGTCLFDPNAGFTRCICDDGYEGANCQTTVSPPDNGGNGGWNLSENTMLLIGIISLCVVLVVVSMVFWGCYVRLNKKYKNLETKQKLINGDDDDHDAKSNSLGPAINYNDADSTDNEKRILLK